VRQLVIKVLNNNLVLSGRHLRCNDLAFVI